MILFTQNKSQKTTLDRNKVTQGDQLLTKTFSIKVLFTWHAASIASISQSFSLVAPQIHWMWPFSVPQEIRFWHSHPVNNNGIHTLSNSPRPKVKVTRNSFSELILPIGGHYLNQKTKNNPSEAQDSNNSKYWPNKTRISTKFKMATTNITWETKY